MFWLMSRPAVTIPCHMEACRSLLEQNPPNLMPAQVAVHNMKTLYRSIGLSVPKCIINVRRFLQARPVMKRWTAADRYDEPTHTVLTSHQTVRSTVWYIYGMKSISVDVELFSLEMLEDFSDY